MNEIDDLAIALEIINRKIAELNLQIIHGDNLENSKSKLEETLKIKEEITNGNVTLIKEIIDGKIV